MHVFPPDYLAYRSKHEVMLTDLEPFTRYTYRIQSVGTARYPGPFSPKALAETLEDSKI